MNQLQQDVSDKKEDAHLITTGGINQCALRSSLCFKIQLSSLYGNSFISSTREGLFPSVSVKKKCYNSLHVAHYIDFKQAIMIVYSSLACQDLIVYFPNVTGCCVFTTAPPSPHLNIPIPPPH